MSYVGNVTIGSGTHLVGSTLYGTCSTASGTAAKVVTCANFDKLITGVTIHVKFDAANGVASPTLNVNGTGAKSIMRYGTTAPSTSAATSWQAGSVKSFTYDGTYWQLNDWTNGNDNNYDRMVLNRAVKAAAAVTKETVIVGTSAGYKTAASGVTFDVSYPILYATAAISSGSTATSTYIDYTAVNLATTKSGWTGTTYATPYLVLSSLSGVTGTIDSTVFTTTAPTSANGKYYIPLGMMYSTTACFFHPTSVVYAYINGAFQQYSQGAWPYTVVKSGI